MKIKYLIISNGITQSDTKLTKSSHPLNLKPVQNNIHYFHTCLCHSRACWPYFGDTNQFLTQTCGEIAFDWNGIATKIGRFTLLARGDIINFLLLLVFNQHNSIFHFVSSNEKKSLVIHNYEVVLYTIQTIIFIRRCEITIVV